MASQVSDEFSKVPVLVTPTEEAVVEGRSVRFSWRSVKGAVRYRVQLASDQSFEEIIHEADVGTQTELTVEDVLPADEMTYFWRVLAEDEDGNVHGADTIESFISATRAEEDMDLAAPADDEQLGPAEQLLKAAKAEVAAEVTHGVRYVEAEEELGVEHEGIEAGQILGLTLAIAVALAVGVVVLFLWVNLTTQATESEIIAVRGYPELVQSRLRAVEQLTQYGVVDAQQGIYRIPIDRAIELMAAEARQATDDVYSPELDLLPRN